MAFIESRKSGSVATILSKYKTACRILGKPFFYSINLKMKYKNIQHKLLADLITPLGVYLKLRSHFAQLLLLESSDYSSSENSRSFICFEALRSFEIDKNAKMKVDGELSIATSVIDSLDQFLASFESVGCLGGEGLFGYTSYDAIPMLENARNIVVNQDASMPLMRYDFYRFVLEFDHFKNELILNEYCPEGEESQLDRVKSIIASQSQMPHTFQTVGSERSNLTDEDYKDLVRKAKTHCQRGDVFQLVLSRRYEQNFKGDDINVYRALRSINPSPYLFYFDYGSYKIFGSSPEAQLKITNGIAEIHPIAGTFKRSGNDLEDKRLAEELLQDPKENAEHIMLVDLARNDLSKSCSQVEVKQLKHVQFYSHLIHLVSKVVGNIDQGTSAFKIFAESFPAGTLSGAPKYKAMELIDKYEKTKRSIYGGSIGMIGFNGDLNQAIVIRSFLSQNNCLSYQAGAGLVISSDEESETEEVKNKLAALKKALVMGENI